MKGSLIHIAAALSLVALLGCSGSDASPVTAGETAAGTQASAVTSASESTAPESTAPSSPGSTVADSTASTPTTVPASDTSAAATSSTIATVPAGWTALDSMPSEAYPPCCASTWQGSPSPPLTADPEPIADGIYNASRLLWSPEQPTQLAIEVRRFDACGQLPASACEPPPDGQAFLDDQIGIADEPVRQMTITLDDTVRVAIGGWNIDLVNGQANGADLADLMVEMKSAYDEVVGGPLLAGSDPEAIVAGLRAAPARGFGSPPVDYSGALLYSYDGAPPILFEVPFERVGSGWQPIDATTVLLLTAIRFDHGLVSLYFYAGYYP